MKKHLDKPWDWKSLSRDMRGEWKLRLGQEFKDELELRVNMMRYKPGGEGYEESREDFESLLNKMI